MTEAFERAKKALSVKSVLLRDSFIALNEDLDTQEIESIKSEIQTFRGVHKVKEVSLQNDEQEVWEYDFFYSCGIRLVEESEQNDGSEVEVEVEAEALVEIRATFAAKYRASEKLDKELIQAFSEENVGYHVWPYWRELVQSSCLRMNIEPLETPMYYCKPVE